MAVAAAAGDGRRFAQTAACLEAQDRLEAALERARELTVGDAPPAFVSPAVGRDAHAELRERREAARRRGRRGRDGPDRAKREILLDQEGERPQAAYQRMAFATVFPVTPTSSAMTSSEQPRARMLVALKAIRW